MSIAQTFHLSNGFFKVDFRAWKYGFWKPAKFNWNGYEENENE